MDRSRRSRVVATTLVACLIATTSCALHHSDPTAGAGRTWITEAEIDSLHAPNAYEIIKRLRPQFLQSHGPVTLDARQPVMTALPNVYVDNQFYGDATVLRDISATAIATITFYNAAEAQYAFGRGNASGVIGIVTKH